MSRQPMDAQLQEGEGFSLHVSLRILIGEGFDGSYHVQKVY